MRGQASSGPHPGPKLNFRLPLFCALFLIYLETVFILGVFGQLEWKGYLAGVLFSAAAGVLLAILVSFGKAWFNKLLLSVACSLLTALFIAQVIYYSIYSAIFSLFSMSEGGAQVMAFWRTILQVLLSRWPVVLLLILPLVLLLVFGRKLFSFERSGLKHKGILAAVVLLSFLGGLLAVRLPSTGLYPPGKLYYETFSASLSASEFGLLTTMRLDLRNSLSDAGEIPAGETDSPTPTPTPGSEPDPTRAPNQLDIDFDQLAAAETDEEVIAMHRYFQSVEPTLQNDWTGKLKGKNLILVTAESFSHLAIDPVLTPTLYKLSRESISFTNFYTPLWPVSTSDGEYTSCLSLIPREDVWSMTASADIRLPFSMGRLLQEEGYRTFAYHNNTYTFYKRNLSHPNMGYEVFQGVGNGLDITSQWPESDLEMIEATAGTYLKAVPFATYYMTVSGHLGYDKSNSMARKNWDAVKDLPFSDAVKAYLACNIELDKAMAALIAELEAAGQAENTVIALYADHYPYGLTNAQVSELAGFKVDTDIELFKNTLLIWHKGIEPLEVDKPGCNLDITPTLANLFGLPFDSRLLMGRDLLSEAEGLVIFSNRSWLNEQGSYDTLARSYSSLTGTMPDQAELRRISQLIDYRFAYSGLILKKDYYARLGLVP